MKKLLEKLKSFWNWLIGKSFKKEQTVITYFPYESNYTDLLVFELINEHRKSLNLDPLIEFNLIDDITASYPRWLHENNIDMEFESHSYFQSRVEQILLRNRQITEIGENLGYGFKNPKSMLASWLKSEGHRKNIEGDYTFISIATIGKFTNTIFIK